MAADGVEEFVVSLEDCKDIPLIPVPDNPRYILISGKLSYSGESVISGFLSSDILNIIKAREGFMRGDLRRYAGSGYAFTTFRTALTPYNIIQLLKYFGYGVVAVSSPPRSPMHGQWKTTWTLESGKLVPLTKTYIALIKVILEEGWKVGEDQRIVERRFMPEIDLQVTTGELHLRVINYMLMTYFKHGDIYQENYENVRDFLDNLREKTNRNFFNLTDIWATSKNRDAFVQKVMEPQTSRIPEQCVLPNMGVQRNILTKQPSDWYDYGPDGNPPSPRMTMTEMQRKRYAKLYVSQVKSMVELDIERTLDTTEEVHVQVSHEEPAPDKPINKEKKEEPKKKGIEQPESGHKKEKSKTSQGESQQKEEKPIAHDKERELEMEADR